MRLQPRQHFILGAQIAVLLLFSAAYALQGNVEFLYYSAIILGFTLLVLKTHEKMHYPNEILWGLVVWTALHMAGGSVPLGDSVLYNWMVIPLSKTLPILRFDQVVHFVGFGVATLLMAHLIRPSQEKKPLGPALMIVIVMAGLGVGALNEIIEFVATLITPNTGVGGYLNTALDLVADLIGAIAAVAWLKLKESRTR